MLKFGFTFCFLCFNMVFGINTRILITENLISHVMANESTPGLYIIIPPDIADDDRLLVGHRYLYGLIVRYSNSEGFCDMKNETLAEKMNMEERTIRRYLITLMDCDYITIENPKNVLRRISTHISSSKLENYRADNFAKQGGQFRDSRVSINDLNKNYDNNSKIQEKSKNDLSISAFSSSSKKSKTKNINHQKNQNATNKIDYPDNLTDKEKKKFRRENQKLRMTSYPKNFSVKETTYSRLLEKYPTVKKNELDEQFLEFEDYYVNGDGQLIRHIDWDRTYVDWIKRAATVYRSIGRNGNNGHVTQRTTPSTKSCDLCTPTKKCGFHDKNSAYHKKGKKK